MPTSILCSRAIHACAPDFTCWLWEDRSLFCFRFSPDSLCAPWRQSRPRNSSPMLVDRVVLESLSALQAMKAGHLSSQIQFKGFCTMVAAVPVSMAEPSGTLFSAATLSSTRRPPFTPNVRKRLASRVLFIRSSPRLAESPWKHSARRRSRCYLNAGLRRCVDPLELWRH